MGNRYALEVCHSLKARAFQTPIYYWNLSLIIPITGTTLPLCMEKEITTYPDMYTPSLTSLAIRAAQVQSQLWQSKGSKRSMQSLKQVIIW